MNNSISPKAVARNQVLLDYAERLLFLLLFLAYASRVWHSLPSHAVNLISVASEALLVAFVLCRRAGAVTTRLLDWVFAFAATILPLLVKPGGAPLAPEIFCGLLMFVGLLLTIWAKLSLRRSFGVAAANRGVVVQGPYRWVRHPMYLGYLFVHVGFLLANPLLFNLALFATAYACQFARIYAEEKLLGEDPAYAALMSRVRFRLIPGVF